MRFLVFGSLNIDHVYKLEHFVKIGETIASETYEKNEGGKGFNQAVALAKAGVKVDFAGAIGDDGMFLTAYLKEVGVNMEHLKTLEVPTGHAVIQVNNEGQNSIILYSGANKVISCEMIDEVLSHYGAGDSILLQNEISNVPYIIRRAKEQAMNVILNPSPVSVEINSWPLSLVDMLILNEVEGEDLTKQQDPQRMLDTLLARYPDCKVVLTLGERGSIYADSKHRVAQRAFTVDVVDTTAAGDTFTGYFIAAVLNGKTIENSLFEATKAAAITVTGKGAGRSIPFANEINRVFNYSLDI